MSTPSSEDLKWLSMLYNERRKLKLIRQDIEAKAYEPVRAATIIAKKQVADVMGIREEEVRKQILELKTKFRMNVEWSLYRKGGY